LTPKQQASSFQRDIWTGIEIMGDTTSEKAIAGDPDGLEEAADRLEAALDRIGRLLDGPGMAKPAVVPVQLAARLDGLISRLRDALNRPPNGGQTGGYIG
jgi:hypothetical protein